MKKEASSSYRFKSLTDFNRVFGLPKPLHPLISFIDAKKVNIVAAELPPSFILDFYQVAYKTDFCGQAKYGQEYYDFGEGGLIFTAPGQVFETPKEYAGSGYTLLIHPDFLLTYSLGKQIRQYGFFSYSVHEALHLSEKEKVACMAIFTIIEEELASRIDDFSQDILVSQVELLLNYSNRFYKRQFITRKSVNHALLQKLDELLREYFENEQSLSQGIPTVHYLAQQLNMSPRYLSDMLRSLTGQNAQQHIHERLIERAKEQLSTTTLTVSEIAYQLGFEHPQSFSTLFKTKTTLSPLAFRRSFN